jgi:hypothetical protein
MRGRTIPLSKADRLVVDVHRFVSAVPSFTERRQMNLSAVAAARAQSAARPRWMAIFVKAYAMVAEEIPELRRVYLPFPWPHFYEYPTSTGLVLVGRDHEGEKFHFGLPIKGPASLPLVEVDRKITYAVQGPKEEVQEFRRALIVASLPTHVRRGLMWLGYHMGRQRPKYYGTFAVTVHTEGRFSGLILPWNTRLSFARLESDGTMDVRVAVDHRIFDAFLPERVLIRLEEVLNGPIVQELRADRAGQPT